MSIKRQKRTKPSKQKRIVIIAGPNGAGKTTFAEEFLAHEANCPTFINADAIARGLGGFTPETVAIQAGRLMLTEIATRFERGENFAFETTLSGLSYANHSQKWRKAGYHVKLIFIRLPSADVAVERVRARVIMGGHHVAEDVVRRRFDLGLKNLQNIYRKLVDSWIVYDNVGRTLRVVAKGHKR